METILTGSDAEIEFTVVGSDGLPFDLSGTNVILVALTQSIKTIGKFATVVRAGYDSDNVEVTNDVGGVFVVRLNSAITAGLDLTYINAEIAAEVINNDYEDGVFTQKTVVNKIAVVQKSKIN